MNGENSPWKNFYLLIDLPAQTWLVRVCWISEYNDSDRKNIIFSSSLCINIELWHHVSTDGMLDYDLRRFMRGDRRLEFIPNLQGWGPQSLDLLHRTWIDSQYRHERVSHLSLWNPFPLSPAPVHVLVGPLCTPSHPHWPWAVGSTPRGWAWLYDRRPRAGWVHQPAKCRDSGTTRTDTVEQEKISYDRLNFTVNLIYSNLLEEITKIVLLPYQIISIFLICSY